MKICKACGAALDAGESCNCEQLARLKARLPTAGELGELKNMLTEWTFLREIGMPACASLREKSAVAMLRALKKKGEGAVCIKLYRDPVCVEFEEAQSGRVLMRVP